MAEACSQYDIKSMHILSVHFARPTRRLSLRPAAIFKNESCFIDMLRRVAGYSFRSDV